MDVHNLASVTTFEHDDVTCCQLVGIRHAWEHTRGVSTSQTEHTSYKKGVPGKTPYGVAKHMKRRVGVTRGSEVLLAIKIALDCKSNKIRPCPLV